MDALNHILHVVRIQPQLFQRGDLAEPGRMEFSASRSSGFHLVEKGFCRFQCDADEIPLQEGDLVVVSNTSHYSLEAVTGDPLASGVIVTNGVFRAEQNIVYPLFSLLPAVIHVRNQDGRPIYWLATALRGIASEAEGERPGYQAVISRLMDILFIMVMRSWIDQQRPGEGGWLGALYDPQIGKVLNAIHAQPDRPWTLETLAHIAVMSRSMFVERFTGLVGEPPMKYVTRWRVQLATTWLGDDDALTVEQIARRVGYESPFAFSKAFKRLTGISPSDYRRIGRPATPRTYVDSHILQ